MRSLFNDDKAAPTFAEAVLQLIGHAIGGAVLFISLAALAWLIGWVVGQLNQTYPFSPAVLSALHGVEVWILYLDIALSGIVLGVGAVKFVRELAAGMKS